MNDQLTTWMSKRHIPSITAMVMSVQALAGPPVTTRTTAGLDDGSGDSSGG